MSRKVLMNYGRWDTVLAYKLHKFPERIVFRWGSTDSNFSLPYPQINKSERILKANIVLSSESIAPDGVTIKNKVIHEVDALNMMGYIDHKEYTPVYMVRTPTVPPHSDYRMEYFAERGIEYFYLSLPTILKHINSLHGLVCYKGDGYTRCGVCDSCIDLSNYEHVNFTEEFRERLKDDEDFAKENNKYIL